MYFWRLIYQTAIPFDMCFNCAKMNFEISTAKTKWYLMENVVFMNKLTLNIEKKNIQNSSDLD